MSAKPVKSLSWVLLVCFAALAASLAQRHSVGVNRLHAGTQLRGRYAAPVAGQSDPADLVAFQTITKSLPDPNTEFWRDAVADRLAAAKAK